MSCGVRYRLSLDPVLLWLWHRPAAVPPVPLAWEPPDVVSTALKKKKISNLLKCVYVPMYK